MSLESPFARAALRDGTLTLHPWSPRLIRGGPHAALLDGLSASLVDLSRTHDRELIVAPVSPAHLDDASNAVLLAWSASVGYQRLWLPAEVISLDPLLAPVAHAVVR